MSTWNIDVSHASMAFSVKHLMISTVRGRFTDFTSTIHYNEAAPTSSVVEATFKVGSIDTHSQQRDDHLRSADFFDAANHPEMIFRSTGISGSTAGNFTVTGDLTIRGVTKPITLDATFEGSGKDPWGNERMAFAARGKVNREAFGLMWNAALETGGVVVGSDVKIELEAEFIRAA